MLTDSIHTRLKLESELSLVQSNSSRGKATMQTADRYAFLIISPILIIGGLVLLKFYYDNPKVIGRTGKIITVIIIFEMFLNLHFLITAGTFK